MMLSRKKLRNGKISVTENPKTVWESDLEFMEYKTVNFRTKRNRLKTEEDQNEDVLFTFFKRFL